MIDNTPVDSLSRTSAATIKRFKALGLHTYGDLLSYYPARYEDFSKVTPISSIRTGEIVTLQGSIGTFTTNQTRKGFKIQKAKLIDKTGKIIFTQVGYGKGTEETLEEVIRENL